MPRNLSLRAYLVILLLCTVIPITLFAAQLVLNSATRERDSIEAGLRDTTRALTTALDRDFQSSIAALDVLASSKRLDSGQLREFYELCERALATQPGWKTILLHETSGKPMLNMLLPPGAVVPDLATAESFARFVEAKKPAFLALTKGATFGWSFGVRLPVLRYGEVKYVLSAIIEPSRTAAILKETALPSSWTGLVYDDNLKVVARTGSGDADIGEPGSLIGKQSADAIEGLLRSENVQGEPSYSFFRRSQLSGWYVVINVPAELLDRPVRRSLLTGAGVALVALVFGFLLATAVSKRITRSVTLIRSLAQGLGLKRKLRPIDESPITELEGITLALYGASNLLQESEAKQLKAEEKLRHSNEDLEQRVVTRTAALHEEIRKKETLENALRSQALLLQLTHEAIIVRSVEDARIQFWNRAASEIYGWSAEEAVGESLPNLLHYRCAQPLKEIHDKLFRDDRWDGEVFHTRKDGTELILESRWSVQRDADGRPVCILEVNSDVTSRRYAEQKLHENDWLARVGTMTSIFAHEIANPLNSIATSMELLEMDVQETVDVHPRMKKTIETSTREIQRVSALLSEFRAFARPRVAKLRSTDLVELLKDVLVPQFAVCKNAGIEIVRDFHALRPILMDPDKIKQVILNLCKNAIEAMPDGGILTIGTHEEKDTAVFEISDTGAGIPKGLDVFQLFKTTKPNGTGLGLPVVRQIIAAHRGSVEYTSAPGQGTTFRVCLRIQPEPEYLANRRRNGSTDEKAHDPIAVVSERTRGEIGAQQKSSADAE